MKRSLILLSLLAGPCLFCSYKAEAGTPTTAETLAEAAVKKPVPAYIYNHFKEYSFFFTYKESDALCAGYCIAPREVGKYWRVGEEEGGAEGVVWRYACRMAAGCPQGCRRVYAGGCMV